MVNLQGNNINIFADIVLDSDLGSEHFRPQQKVYWSSSAT